MFIPLQDRGTCKNLAGPAALTEVCTLRMLVVGLCDYTLKHSNDVVKLTIPKIEVSNQDKVLELSLEMYLDQDSSVGLPH